MSSPTIDVFELDGSATVRSSDGAFLRVQTPSGAPVPLVDAFHGQVRQQLDARAAQREHPRLGRERLALLAPDAGWEPIASVLTGLDVQRIADTGISTQRHGLVIQVAATRAERTALDALPSAGTAVLRCYREGEILFVDPLALCSADPTGSQVVRRRLAASVASADLDGWLNITRPSDATLEDLPSLAQQFLGVRIRAMVAAWQHDTSELAVLRRTLWRLDTRTLCSSEHPVLGFAEPAKRPGPPR
ncbi:hypothetical protein [Arthrobacter glacialis]|uniref:Uncharacterized protein n=1 Tax=Arthrobacter glacialis TaxID=1664 RepID=A0A2S3ZR97_ARTGL|nr:hypothetical protein [Arthrobacter glacialis]POH71756.1 hypothetical protein CVS27_19260 [Arthrobacter glacialis]